ncbi:chorismate-binding protein [Tamlana sp. 62-3]|uniref:Chorismate-binding protein n=1 Tax=Neotamlana sargassicola TaxID=2883125 RepID=A0A9X1L5B3_9FLAO|nr:chorismate-binding protein [Tamlana sargassicola]MCB4809000.1 chorismate-binding protein [Tamlana sargassicola]
MTSNEFFKRIETQYQNNLPFVVYRKPNEASVFGMLQKDDKLHFTSNFTEKGFVFSPFENINESVLIPTEVSEYFESETDFPDLNSVENSMDSSNTSEENHHIKLVEKSVRAIKNGAFKKVVVSRAEAIQLDEPNPLLIFKRLVHKYKSAFAYCWFHPKVGLWLGATPETLMKVEGANFSIMALAGTQEYKRVSKVVWQDKEKEEQQFVTDFIVEQLKPWVSTYKLSDVETVKAGNLLHLKTMINARLKPEIPLKNIIESIHPTPAVCGLPKAETKTFILENENYNREFYTGFLGELNFETIAKPRSGRRNIENRAYAIPKKSTQLYVNLRCMQIQNNNAIVYVGGGITETSVPENEWQETVFKSKVIKNVLS